MAKREVDDRFKKFGTVSFTSITKINDFVDYAADGKVMGTRCRECGLTFFPPRSDCYQCLPGEMDWFEVSGAGKLITYSKLEYAPIGFRMTFLTVSPCWTMATTRYSEESTVVLRKKT